MIYDIGIIGGAGPMAGQLFFHQIIEWYQKKLGAWRDQDFPSIIMVSYPFSDMLTERKQNEVLQKELHQVMNDISAKFLLIACNTLHLFIDENNRPKSFIHLMQTTAEAICDNLESVPLLLGTTTSVNNQLHKKYFECSYPSLDNQMKIDEVIDTILKGKHNFQTAKLLQQIIQSEVKKGQKAVLGCTELSQIVHEYPILHDQLIDPCQLAIQKVCSLLNPLAE